MGKMTRVKVVTKNKVYVIGSPSVLAPNGVEWIASQQNESIK